MLVRPPEEATHAPSCLQPLPQPPPRARGGGQGVGLTFRYRVAKR